jgi:hypothetical protein
MLYFLENTICTWINNAVVPEKNHLHLKKYDVVSDKTISSWIKYAVVPKKYHLHSKNML